MNGRKILVVDDEADILSMLTEFFQNSGYEVHAATDGQMALEKAESLVPDIILMDIILPKVDGWLVCQKLKADDRLKNIPIILFSGMLVSDSAADPLVEKCNYLIAKPFQMQELLQKVREFAPTVRPS